MWSMHIEVPRHFGGQKSPLLRPGRAVSHPYPKTKSGGFGWSGSVRFGQVRSDVNMVRFGQVHREPGPNLTEPGHNWFLPWAFIHTPWKRNPALPIRWVGVNR